jgi:phosphate starvation-inducible membrane PsiE
LDSNLSPLVRLLLWDHPRGSLAYELAVLLLVLILILVPGGFWNDPFWRVR